MEQRSVFLVRHGQASFGKSDYDRLSEAGHRQAFLLGQDLARRGWVPDRVVSGTLRRHRETLAEICVGAGWDHLQPDTDQGWNELDHVEVINAYRPAYRNMLLLKADMVRTLRPREAFEEMFEAAITRWAGGEHDADYRESFEAFHTRVSQSFGAVTAQPLARQLVVTSAGPVCQISTELTAGHRDLTVWKSYSLSAANTGVTRISIDKKGARLLSFNEIGHLDGAQLVTKR